MKIAYLLLLMLGGTVALARIWVSIRKARDRPAHSWDARLIEKLRAAGVEVHAGLLEARCCALNPGFHSRLERGRPWVRVKLGMSLDGRTALASGESRWITGPEAREDVHRQRDRADLRVAR